LITQQQLMGAVAELHVLKFWPKGESEDLTMASFLDRLVTTPQQLRWLVNTLIDQVGTYDGTDQIRAVFCSQFQPKDGVQAYLKPGHSLYKTEEEYIADWKRKEAEEREEQVERYQLAASQQKLLTGDVTPTPDPIVEFVAPLAAAKVMPPVNPPALLSEIEYEASLASCERARQRQIAENERWLRKYQPEEVEK
jgi:hypothetical protein